MTEVSNIEINPNKEYILAGDISASMTSIDPKCGGQSRFNYMLEKFQSFIQTAQDFDKHGAPTILLFGEKVHTFKDTKLADISQNLAHIGFEGFTNLHLCIEQAYQIHRDEKRELAAKGEIHPGTCLFVFTDGDPTNRAQVERDIVMIANSIDREDEFQITFLTVGTQTPALTNYLKNLHDGLEKQITTGYDIIHVDALENVTFFAAVSGKLNHVA